MLILKMQSGLVAVILTKISCLVQLVRQGNAMTRELGTKRDAQDAVQEIKLQSGYVVREWLQELKSIHARVKIYFK